MAMSIPEQKLKDIEAVVSAHPKGIAIQDIHRKLDEDISRRTLQYRLKQLVDEGRLVKAGEKRGTKYLPPSTECEGKTPEAPDVEMAGAIPISKRATEIQKHVRKPGRSRNPVGYKRAFLDEYRPNDTAYLSGKERAHLREVGTPLSGEQPAGTYAKQILNRLLIDLSWNSSRLEGNTYSLLDTND